MENKQALNFCWFSWLCLLRAGIIGVQPCLTHFNLVYSSFLFFCSLFKLSPFIVCMSVTCMQELILSSMEVLWIRLGLSVLLGSAFTCQAILSFFFKTDFSKFMCVCRCPQSKKRPLKAVASHPVWGLGTWFRIQVLLKALNTLNLWTVSSNKKKTSPFLLFYIF